MRTSLVVKIGGSLMDRVPDLIAELREFRVLIVPGGGSFADLVRASQVGDQDAAHWMAIAAMEQYGWYISSFGLPVTERPEIPRAATVLLPYRALRDLDPLPHRWEVSSDTIAGWIAARLGLELLLVKSVDGIRSGGVLLDRISTPVETGDVDPCIIPFALARGVKVCVVNGRRPGLLRGVLGGESRAGTTICI
ncbi:aspartokinase-like uncharacterized kinase [Methanolinea mesophila]|uniref:uridylate kinase n=1 Tax=Methanolinea mesophila TaxID=547055 RepID=UPI001AE22ED9|nr:uridylate kinase [Methanolinea mesophila]MBP1928571.1 aspartokinase-like uncharacterized kinase [Methanolinea mesophila]